MNFIKEQRENRRNGFEEVENVLQMTLEGVEPRFQEKDICLSMRGGGSQAIPASHARRRPTDPVEFDEIPSEDGNPELAMLKKEESLFNGDDDLLPDD